MLETFCLQNLGKYSAIFEGWTDVSYLEIAVEKYELENQINLCQLTTEEGEFELTFHTPGKNGDPSRGGTPQMIRFAQKVSPYLFTLGCSSGIVFVFDHDDAGIEAENSVCSKDGFKKNQHTLTLSPKAHPNACTKKQVVVEDLLSLDIQKRFFATGNAFCDVVYEAGEIVRFKWGTESKSLLRDFVKEHATLKDLNEIVGLVTRIRTAWGFGC